MHNVDDEWIKQFVLGRSMYISQMQWDWGEAKRLAKQRLLITKRMGSELEVIRLESILAYYATNCGERETSHHMYSKLMDRARSIIQSNDYPVSVRDELLIGVYGGASENAMALGRYSEGLSYVKQVLDLALLNQTKFLCVGEMGSIYMIMGELPKAIVQFEKCIEMRFHIEEVITNYIAALALCYACLGERLQALRKIEEADASNAFRSNTESSGIYDLYIGDTYQELGSIREALPYYRSASRSRAPSCALAGLHRMGTVLAAQGDGVGAAFYLGAVASTGTAWLRDRQAAETTLAGLRDRFPADVIDAALAEGAASPLGEVVARVQVELAELDHPPEGSELPG